MSVGTPLLTLLLATDVGDCCWVVGPGITVVRSHCPAFRDGIPYMLFVSVPVSSILTSLCVFFVNFSVRYGCYLGL